MAKFLLSLIKVCFDQPSAVDVLNLSGMQPQRDHLPILITYQSGSGLYFRYTVLAFEVPYLNLIPCCVLAFASELAPPESALWEPAFGATMGIIGALPCAYLIGICVDELSHQLGLVLGAILNSIFLTIVELILYYFSLKKGLADVVRSAVTGCFLMNLLIIPGFGMLAAGLKWNEVVLNKRSQAISGTFLFLSVSAVLFPSVFYHVHETQNYDCGNCTLANLTEIPDYDFDFTCNLCNSSAVNMNVDPVYQQYGSHLMATMAIGMPLIYCIGVFFSLKTHAHIYEPDHDQPHEAGPAGEMSKVVALVVLILSTGVFSLMAHVITDKIPELIDQIGLSQRFVGLVFFTLIPNAAEYMNAIKFALNGNIGLSMEIGNQGAILTALIEFPALVLLSYVMQKLSDDNDHMNGFTLVFPYMDVFCVIIAVLLRNSILMEKSINWFTGTSFLIIFLLISFVYFFEIF
jgi:Ca2+:H+ antiporter